LTEAERYAVADHVIAQLKEHGDPWHLSEEARPKKAPSPRQWPHDFARVALFVFGAPWSDLSPARAREAATPSRTAITALRPIGASAHKIAALIVS
jgi:hypothetical protein